MEPLPGGWSPDGTLPGNCAAVRNAIFDGRGLSRVPVSVAVARGVPVPALRRRQGLGGWCHPFPMFGLRPPDLSDRGYLVPRYAEASHHLVSGYVVCDQPEERSQRTGFTAGPGTGQLSHGLVMAA